MTQDKVIEALNYAIVALKDAASRLDTNNDLYLNAIQSCYDVLDTKVTETSQSDDEEDVVFPILSGGIYQHEKLGELYDRLQVHSYAVKHCQHFVDSLSKPQPTSQDVIDAGALIIERVVNELKAYSPQADEYKGEHIHKYWAKTLSGALDAMKEDKT